MCSDEATRPAATRTSTAPVRRKKRDEVQPQGPAVDAEAEADGDGEAEHHPETRRPRVARIVERGEQEDRRLEALAQHGQEGHGHERHRRALGQSARGVLLQLPLEVAGVLGHPDDHVGDHPDRDERHDRLQALLLAVGELVVDDPQHDRHGKAQHHGQADAEPHRAQRVRASLAAQEGGDDADDERGLEALAQRDHERRQQGNLQRPRVRST